MNSNLRSRLKKNFTTTPNAIITDSELKPNSKLIFLYMASKPDDWIVHNKDVMRALSIQKDHTIAGYFKELIKAGWITRAKYRNDQGQITGGYAYYLNERPIPPMQESDDEVDADFEEPIDATVVEDEPTQHKQSCTAATVINITNTNIVNVSPKVHKLKADIETIIADLNSVTGKKFLANTKATVKLLMQRLSEGHTVEQFQAVHRAKHAEWANDTKMCKYLVPETLYAEANLSKYVNQLQFADDTTQNTAKGGDDRLMRINISNKITETLATHNIPWQRRVLDRQEFPEAIKIFGKEIGYMPNVELSFGKMGTLFFFKQPQASSEHIQIGHEQ